MPIPDTTRGTSTRRQINGVTLRSGDEICELAALDYIEIEP